MPTATFLGLWRASTGRERAGAAGWAAEEREEWVGAAAARDSYLGKKRVGGGERKV